MMKKGKVTCDCGNEFYFQSTRNQIPCMKCGKLHDNNGEIVVEEIPEETEV